MTKIRRIDFYPDDFLVGVAGMPAEDIGVYWVICSLMYSSGGAIREDDTRIFRVLGCRPSKVRRSIERLKGASKLSVSGSYLVSIRAESELKRAQNRIETAQENGAKGGRPKELGKPGGFSPAKLSNINHQSSSSASDGAESAPPTSQTSIKAEIFDKGLAYLQAKGKSRERAASVIGKWRKDGYGDGAIIDAICRAESDPTIQEPVSWITAVLKRHAGGDRAGFRFTP